VGGLDMSVDTGVWWVSDNPVDLFVNCQTAAAVQLVMGYLQMEIVGHKAVQIHNVIND